jgi:hypothetical protein
LYGSIMHPAQLCEGFWTIIFFCLVCGPLEKKKKKDQTTPWPFQCRSIHVLPSMVAISHSESDSVTGRLIIIIT